MSKRIFSGILVSLLLIGILTLAFNIQPVKAQPTTIIVPDEYPTIQAAINNATDGDTVFVRNGTYFENVVVNKAVSLAGENKYGTTIDGGGADTVVDIESNNVSVIGFTIRGSATEHSARGYGVITGPHNCNMSDNIISDNQGGILVSDSSGNTISNNIIRNNSGVGVDITWQSCTDNHIVGNVISGSGTGIYISNCADSVITVSGNIISGNEWGIWIRYSRATTLYENEISNNNWDGWGGGLWINGGAYNRFYHNSFINNTGYGQAIASGLYLWDDGYPSGGNYWSDYVGNDTYSSPYQNETGRDGIGDTVYVINGWNADHYPLMKPYAPLIRADVNNDGKVDIRDISIVARAFGTVQGDLRWNPDADVNRDGKVDIRDIALTAKNFGQHYP